MEDTCEACPRGWYRAGIGNSPCTKCPPGHTTPTKGSTAPTSCAPCPANTYSSIDTSARAGGGEGVVCLPCPGELEAPVSSTNASACVCLKCLTKKTALMAPAVRRRRFQAAIDLKISARAGGRWGGAGEADVAGMLQRMIADYFAVELRDVIMQAFDAGQGSALLSLRDDVDEFAALAQTDARGLELYITKALPIALSSARQAAAAVVRRLSPPGPPPHTIHSAAAKRPQELASAWLRAAGGALLSDGAGFDVNVVIRVGCGAGFEPANQASAALCIQCEREFFKEGLLNESCVPCGTFADSQNQQGVTCECLPGYTISGSSSGRCAPCVPGTYKEARGNHSCTPCPEGKVEGPAASSASDACTAKGETSKAENEQAPGIENISLLYLLLVLAVVPAGAAIFLCRSRSAGAASCRNVIG